MEFLDNADAPHYSDVRSPLPSVDAGPEAVLAALQEVDWSAFTPARDLRSLRARLAELEQRSGVTDAHRFVTERLVTSGALLRHPDGHPAEITGFALSPDGRHLAVGSWCGDDYETGGILQIWEVPTARCVNTLHGIEGGVGWPDYGHMIQWSADGQRIAFAFNTNVVGSWEPFGLSTDLLGHANVTDGYSRPPTFAFAPDGTRAHITMWSGRAVPGCIAPLAEGPLYFNDDLDNPNVGFLAEELPAAVSDLMGDEQLGLERAFWSRDGARLLGYGDGLVFAVDVATGRMSWFAEAESRGVIPAWSADERLVAYQTDSRLVIADAATGRQITTLPNHPGASELSWGSRDGVAQLAVVVPENNDADATPRVLIYDESGTGYGVAAALKEVSREELDGATWAWAPDGRHAAGLTENGQIQIWSLGQAPDRLSVVESPEDAYGLLWGADGVLVAVGPSALRFVQAATGETIGDFAFLRAPSGLRPLEIDGEDIGENLRDSGELTADPTFALDDGTWAVAFESGLVIAPSDRRDALDGALAWTVERRFAWPIRWGELVIVPDAATGAQQVDSPLTKYAEQFQGQSGLDTVAGQWPPPNIATVDDLFQFARSARAALHSGWDYHVSENLRCAARLRARRGEAAEATELLESIPTQVDYIRGCADVAMILAAAGQADQARQIFSFTEQEVEDELDRHNVAFVASAVGGAYAALGDTARADAWFDRARAAIEPETNSGEHRLSVAWALIECGRVDDARAVWQAAAETLSTFYSVPFLAYLVRTGREDLAREVLTFRDPAADEWQDHSWFDGWEAVELFAGFGRADLIHTWAEIYGSRYAYEELVERAEANARTAGSRPTEADLDSLADAYATLQKTPRTRRERPTELLILQAARCGHISAVLDLLPALPADDFNGRAGHAFHALWLVTTGADVPTW
ncbi:WD40 repeat domain-containing protein [Hamadaea sp. NPDC051192]|uniref:WD40 repeat domain-containing protein n=1 Tax=Hamadaea sp. NPDC051192 TaxID=3154940 RepID=UPI003445A92A